MSLPTPDSSQPHQTRWSIDNYRTLAVAPAPPGWFAIYRNDDETYYTEPAVAMLTQEYTGTTWYSVCGCSGEDSRRRVDEPPSADDDNLGRIVLAVVDRENGELRAADRFQGVGGPELVCLATEREIADEWQELFDEALAQAKRKKAAQAAGQL
jgi:hypothetical protein